MLQEPKEIKDQRKSSQSGNHKQLKHLTYILNDTCFERGEENGKKKI